MSFDSTTVYVLTHIFLVLGTMLLFFVSIMMIFSIQNILKEVREHTNYLQVIKSNVLCDPIRKYKFTLPNEQTDIDNIMRGILEFVSCDMISFNKHKFYVGQKMVVNSKIKCEITNIQKFDDYGVAFDKLGNKFSSLATREDIIHFNNMLHKSPEDTYPYTEYSNRIKPNGIVAIGIKWIGSDDSS